jgi:hypothetical protein
MRDASACRGGGQTGGVDMIHPHYASFLNKGQETVRDWGRRWGHATIPVKIGHSTQDPSLVAEGYPPLRAGRHSSGASVPMLRRHLGLSNTQRHATHVRRLAP